MNGKQDRVAVDRVAVRTVDFQMGQKYMEKSRSVGEGNGSWNGYRQHAMECFRLSAEAGEVRAYAPLAQCCYHAKRIDEAVAWWKKAAVSGVSSACLALAYCYRDGVGVDLDTVKALAWTQRAAECGHPLALYSMAKHNLAVRTGGADDDSMTSVRLHKALRFARAAAETGHNGGMRLTGELYIKMAGCKREEANHRDLVRAYVWLYMLGMLYGTNANTGEQLSALASALPDVDIEFGFRMAMRRMARMKKRLAETSTEAAHKANGSPQLLGWLLPVEKTEADPDEPGAYGAGA